MVLLLVLLPAHPPLRRWRKRFVVISNTKRRHSRTDIDPDRIEKFTGEIRSLISKSIIVIEKRLDTCINLLGPYEHLHSMLQNKMATANLGFES